jgi:hypothetical protein
VKFIHFSFAHLTWTCSTPQFYRHCIHHYDRQFSSSQDTNRKWKNILIIWPVEWHVAHCHTEVFNAPYGHSRCPLPPLCSKMNVPGPRTVSSKSDVAASHSYKLNTVLNPISYSDCQLTLNVRRRYIRSENFSVQKRCKIFAVTEKSLVAPLHTCTTYICSVYCMFVTVYWTNGTRILEHFSTTINEIGPCILSVVRKMKGYNSQRRDTAQT